MLSYLVTGGAGFIGAAVAQKLLDEGSNVIVIDNLSTGFYEKIPDKCIKIIGNTYDDEVIRLLDSYQLDGIFHIAGQSGGVTSYKDPVYDMRANVESTIKLLQHCRDHKCNKFIFASSMSVYGDKNPCPVAEDGEKNPTTFYAIGKLASEHYMQLYASQFGINCVALRLNNVYGPGQNMDNLLQGMVSIFLAQAVRNRHIHVMGDKERFRDFVYIDDVVDAFICSMRSGINGFEAYNVSTGTATTVEHLIGKIKKLLPFDVMVNYEGTTPGDQFGIYCDSSKLQKSLEWKPRTGLDEGLEQMVSWALKG